MPSRTVTITIPENKRLLGESIWVKKPYTRSIENLDAISQSYSLISTTEKNPKILNTILEMINSAKKTIFLSTFILENKEVEDALMDAVKRLNGNVYVLTVLDTTVFKNLSGIEGEVPEELRAHERFKELAKNGIYIRQHPNCHAKFLIVDKEEALLTSANIRDTSLKKNVEIGIRIKNPIAVSALSSLFQHLWVHQTDRHYAPYREGSTLSSIPWKYPKKEVPAPKGTITWTENQNHYLLKTLVEHINKAKDKIIISTYNFRELDKNEVKVLFDSLAKALDRKVEIEILTHITQDKNGQRTTECDLFSSLIKARSGLRLFGHPTLHAKYMIVDGKSVIIFTGNFDGRHGLSNGIDIGIVLENKDIAERIYNWHEQIKNACPMEILHEPTPKELKQGDATYLLEGGHFILETKSTDSNEIISKLAILDGDNIALAYRSIEHFERYKLKDDDDTISREIENTGFHIPKNSLSLMHRSQRTFEITLETIKQVRTFGFLSPGKHEFIVKWPMSTDEFDQWLQSYLFSKSPKTNGHVCTLVNIITEYMSKYTSVDLPFTNSSENWKEYLDKIFGKGIWNDYDIQEEEIFITATEMEIKEILESVEIIIDERTSKKKGPRTFEIISQNAIKGKIQSIKKPMPKRFKDWTKIQKFLPGKDWSRTSNAYERRKKENIG